MLALKSWAVAVLIVNVDWDGVVLNGQVRRFQNEVVDIMKLLRVVLGVDGGGCSSGSIRNLPATGPS